MDQLMEYINEEKTNILYKQNIQKINFEDDYQMYKIGDIIEATIDDFNLSNDRFQHRVKGTIVGIYKDNNLKGYDVKLFKTIYCELYIPKPLTDKYKDYIQPKINEDMMDIGYIFTPMNLIFINHNNIISHCCQTKLKNMTFLEGLKQIWSKLIFRTVKTIIKNSDELEIVEYVHIDENKKIQIDIYPTLKEAFHKVPKKYHRNIRGRYKEYYGFTTLSDIRQNDIYSGKEIFFSKKSHSELDLETGKFNKNKCDNTWPPRKNQLICGIPEQGEKGLFFRKWFICSRQFLTLWTMMFYPKHASLHNLNIIRNQHIYSLKSFGELLNELDTRPLHPNYNQSLEQIQNRYRIINVESISLQSTDKYQIIAKMAFLSDEIEKIKKIKADRSNISMLPILSNSLIGKTFQEKLYDNILWMFDA